MKRWLALGTLASLLATAPSMAQSTRPSLPTPTGYDACASRISPGEFWTSLMVRDTRCVRGALVAKRWITLYERSGAVTRRVTARGFRCRGRVLKASKADNPYVRVICTRGEKRVRFYGLS